MAGAVLNRIPTEARNFLEISPLWIAESTMDSTPLDTSVDIEKYENYGSVVVSLLNTGSTNEETLIFNNDGTSSTCITTEDDLNSPIEFWSWVKCDSPSTVTIDVILYQPSGTIEKQNSKSIIVSTSDWVLIKSEQLIVDNNTYNYRIGANIHFSSSTVSAKVYLTSPVILGVMDIVDNEFAYDAWISLIPEYMRDEDRTSSQQYAFLRFLDVLTTVAGQVKSFVFSAAYADVSEGYDPDDETSKSVFVDPSVANKIFLNYLAQFVGTKLVNPRTGSTPWINLPSTWIGIDNIDAVSDNQVPWGVMELFSPEPADLINFLRWQTEYGFYGLNAGSKKAVVESVKRVLSETKSILYSVTAPFEVTIETLYNETPNTLDLSVGDEVVEIIALIEPARPLGTKVKHVLA